MCAGAVALLLFFNRVACAVLDREHLGLFKFQLPAACVRAYGALPPP
jgi:hypothetical protein